MTGPLAKVANGKVSPERGADRLNPPGGRDHLQRLQRLYQGAVKDESTPSSSQISTRRDRADPRRQADGVLLPAPARWASTSSGSSSAAASGRAADRRLLRRRDVIRRSVERYSRAQHRAAGPTTATEPANAPRSSPPSGEIRRALPSVYAAMADTLMAMDAARARCRRRVRPRAVKALEGQELQSRCAARVQYGIKQLPVQNYLRRVGGCRGRITGKLVGTTLEKHLGRLCRRLRDVPGTPGAWSLVALNSG